jgi:tetratricopeptide (TPR) repeat protein
VTRAIARLLDAGVAPHHLGTAFCVSSRHAVTAFHCVGRREDATVFASNVKLDFGLDSGNLSIEAIYEDGDPRADFALLTLRETLPSGLEPISLTERVERRQQFVSYGFPVDADKWQGVIPVPGYVTDPQKTLADGTPVLSLHIDAERLSLHGLSGGPVLIGDRDTAAGLVSTSQDDEDYLPVGSIVYACPTSLILARCPLLQLRVTDSTPDHDVLRRSLAYLDAELARFPGDAALHLVRANTLRRLDQPRAAVEPASRAIDLDPSNAEAYATRGLAQMALARTDAALVDFDRALTIDSQNFRALAGRGSALRMQRRPRDALADIDHALELEPDAVAVLADRAAVLTMLGRNDEALRDFDRVVDVDPRPWALGLRVENLIALGRLKDAEADLDQLIAADPANPVWLARRGSVKARRGNKQEALDDAEKALKLAPDDPDALVAQAEALYPERSEDALRILGRALQHHPDHRSARMRRAWIHRDRGRPLDGLQDLDEVLRVAPDDVEALSNRAFVNLRLNRAREAFNDADRALELSPGFVAALVNRGVAYAYLGDVEAAERDISSALQLDPDSATAIQAKDWLRQPRGPGAAVLGWALRRMSQRKR